MTPQEIVSMFGDACPVERFGSIYSRTLARFLGGPDVNDTARLLSCHVSELAETVVFEIDVVLPQHPLADIRERESIACQFPLQNEIRPDVLALRPDFPRLPHQNLRDTETPRSICLSSTSWSESKHLWSPSSFLESIRGWLGRAATGTLHAPGQPREPLLGRPHGYLILPSKVEFGSLDKLEIAGEHDSSPVIMWAKRAAPGAKPGKGKFKLICFEMPAREHGLIEALPQDLAELEKVCSSAGFDLRRTLVDKLKSDAPAGDISTSEFSFQLLLVLHLDVTGKEHPDIVTHEEWAFMIGKALDVGEALGVMASSNGIVGPLVVASPPSEEAIKKIQVLPVALFRRLDEKLALASSGLEIPYPPVAVIGIGSLGSKCVEILARQGLAKAVLIDADRLFPHNTARHVLLGNAVGFTKAPAMAHLLRIQHDFDERQEASGFTSIAENFAIPTNATVDAALATAEYVLDFSASVGVSRGLSSLDSAPRCFSAFLTPGADTFFVHQEDRERSTRLDWLEAITLRAIVEDEKLRHAYSRNSSQIWYGGPCREVSTVLPNQNVSLFAAAGAGIFTRHHASSLAKCIGYNLDPETMALEAVEIEATAPATAQSKGWAVNYDSKLVERMKSMRAAAFPKETGGVLFGVLNRERMSCSVVIASASPPDSEAWPDAYIRGAEGLKALVDRVGELTAGQLQYVGEWHSHPSGSSSRPSETDHEALRILTEIMGREGLPAVTFIVGEEPEPCVTTGWSPQT